MRDSCISISSDAIEVLLVWIDVRLHFSVYPTHFIISVAHSLLDVAKNGKFSAVGYFTDNTFMADTALFQAFLIHVSSRAGDVVVRVYCHVSQLMMTIV